jgi:hypothetical protein
LLASVPPLPPLPPVRINSARLAALGRQLLTATTNTTIDDIEVLYFQLYRAVYAYETEADKAGLLDAVQALLEA